MIARSAWLAALGWAGWLLCPAVLPAAAPRPADAPTAIAPQPQQLMVMIRLPPTHFTATSDYGGSYGDALGRGARRRIAASVARRYGLTIASDWPMPLVGVHCFVMTVPPGGSSAAVAARISRERTVAWAEPIELYTGQAAPLAYNDPLFPMQPAARDWRLADLHRFATGRSVRVAVIDSKVDAAHPDLARQVEVSRDFNPNQAEGPERHGTGVAGVIAARANNAQGIVGIAPDARLMALRACVELRPGRSAASCDSLSLAKALIFAINSKADIFNLSLSGPPAPLLGKLLDVALTRGAILVAAFDPALADGGFPASHAGVIAVASESAATQRSVYVAPGRDVLTTEPGATWGLANGSSYAAAHVSGLFALLRERGPLRSKALAVAPASARLVDPCASLLRVAAGSGDCAPARGIASAATQR